MKVAIYLRRATVKCADADSTTTAQMDLHDPRCREILRSSANSWLIRRREPVRDLKPTEFQTGIRDNSSARDTAGLTLASA